MKKQELIHQLIENHTLFISYIDSLKEEEFNFSYKEKWTAGQQLEHIFLCVKPLTQVFLLPKFIIGIVFGKANRPSKSYEELVKKYLSKLQQGVSAIGKFVPRTIEFNQKIKLIKALQTKVEKLNIQISNFSEKELDTLILPHPLLGKLTLREMIYFTIYHVEHHLEITKRNLLTA